LGLWKDRLFAGGRIDKVYTTEAHYIAQWDGASWESVGLGLGPHDFNYDPFVSVVMPYNDRLVVGGRFSVAGSVDALNIAQWDGLSWSPMGEGISSAVHGLAIYHDELYAGVDRWTGTTWMNELKTDGPVYALTVYRDRLIAGGSFTEIDGRPSQNIGAWPDEGTAVEQKSMGSVKAMYR
jgi:hypothetical protein